MAQVTISEETARFCLDSLEFLGHMAAATDTPLHPERGLQLILAMAELDQGLDAEMPADMIEKTRATLQTVREMMSTLESETETEETEELVY
jgi:hypothetical protein